MYFDKIKKKKHLKKICAGLLLAGTLVISGKVDCGAIDTQSINQLTPAATTCYDYLEWTLWTYRYKIVSSKVKTTTEFEPYKTISTYVNNSSKVQQAKYTESETKSASITLGNKVKKLYLVDEIKGEASYSKTETYELQTTIPKRKTMLLKKRIKTEITDYNSTFQKQHFLIIDQSWNNEGKAFKSTSTRKEKSPQYKWVEK